MRRLIDFLTFKDPERRAAEPDLRLYRAERDAALLTDKYPPESADLETVPESRLANLMQYPHY
jgi:hypothetical protein